MARRHCGDCDDDITSFDPAKNGGLNDYWDVIQGSFQVLQVTDPVRPWQQVWICDVTENQSIAMRGPCLCLSSGEFAIRGVTFYGPNTSIRIYFGWQSATDHHYCEIDSGIEIGTIVFYRRNEGAVETLATFQDTRLAWQTHYRNEQGVIVRDAFPRNIAVSIPEIRIQWDGEFIRYVVHDSETVSLQQTWNQFVYAYDSYGPRAGIGGGSNLPSKIRLQGASGGSLGSLTFGSASNDLRCMHRGSRPLLIDLRSTDNVVVDPSQQWREMWGSIEAAQLGEQGLRVEQPNFPRSGVLVNQPTPVYENGSRAARGIVTGTSLAWHGMVRILFNARDRNNCHCLEIIVDNVRSNDDFFPGSYTADVVMNLIRRVDGSDAILDTKTRLDIWLSAGQVQKHSWLTSVSWDSTEVLASVDRFSELLEDSSPMLIEDGNYYGWEIETYGIPDSPFSLILPESGMVAATYHCRETDGAGCDPPFGPRELI